MSNDKPGNSGGSLGDAMIALAGLVDVLDADTLADFDPDDLSELFGDDLAAVPLIN